MWRLVVFVGVLLCVPAFSLAQDCIVPDPKTANAEREPMFEALLKARNEAQGRKRASSIWESWHKAPNQKAQELLNIGKSKLREANYVAAQELLTELIEYCPTYAEGWNQRAFAKFLAGDLEGSLEDLDRTLQLEPRHFGALAGRGLTLLRQGRTLLAHKALREAVAIHPWIGERHLLPPEQKT